MYVPKLDDLVEYRDYLNRVYDNTTSHLKHCIEVRNTRSFNDPFLDDHIHELKATIKHLERIISAIDTLESAKDLHPNF